MDKYYLTFVRLRDIFKWIKKEFKKKEVFNAVFYFLFFKEVTLCIHKFKKKVFIQQQVKSNYLINKYLHIIDLERNTNSTYTYFITTKSYNYLRRVRTYL